MYLLFPSVAIPVIFPEGFRVLSSQVVLPRSFSSISPGLLFRFPVSLVKQPKIVYSIIWFISGKANSTGSYKMPVNHMGFAQICVLISFLQNYRRIA